MNRDRLADVFWERHANPASGWTRALATPVLVACVYYRRWRALGLVLAFLGVNPVLFPPPDPDEDSWMTRGVRAEREWLASGDRSGWPNQLNVCNVPVFAGALWAAYQRRPVWTASLTVLSMALKFAFVDQLIRIYGDRPLRTGDA